ncbi:hypothetical protein, conserved [Babesia ovata]|uniref:C3H1-type domain-containing protein n=1 Tax=Babesia ovata TaxID=189622 RepID=A0A2H6KJE7_9APIC|nr:uncharacterized protein BOVATA_045920 [Babesia ovata]GBE63099.1 hypothetical protein, conserved [Babesia ovata]
MCHFTSSNYLLTFFPLCFCHLNCLGHYSFDNSPKSHCQSLNDKIDLLKNSDKSTDNSQNDSKIADLKSQLKDHVAKYHSLSESDRTAQLKDIQSRMLSLAELSGKLGQFIGQSDAVTKAINDGIDAIIDSDNEFKSLKNSQSSPAQPSAAVPAGLINDAELEQKIKSYEALKKPLEERQNDKISPLSSEDSRLLSSHQSKLDALQTLKSLNESLNSLSKNNDNNCKNLLEHLCTGLENFLGYQDGNYTGKGIVYSDLDRLCDGVMAFLHGVLESVKDDESVTIYDVKEPSKDITSVIAFLNSNVGKGRQAFPSAVHKVSEWLKKHAAQVEERTGEVKNKLGELIGNLSSGAGENENVYYKNVKEQEEHKLQDQLKSWKSTLVSLKNEVDGIRNTQIKALDNTLQSQITHKIDPITSVIEHLQNSASDEVMAACQAVDDRLTEQQKKVTDQITEYCEGLLEVLYERFTNVFEKINDLQGARSEQFARIKDLVNFLNDAVGHVVKNYDKTYNHRISEHFESIRTLLQTVDPSKKNPGSQHSQLHDDVEQIKSNLITVGKELQGYVESLGNKNKEAEQMRSEAHNQASKALEMVKDQDENKYPTKIENAANVLKTKIEWLKTTYDSARAEVSKAKDAALQTLGQLDGLIKTDLGDLKEQINTEIWKHVKDVVQKVMEAATKADTKNMYRPDGAITPGFDYLNGNNGFEGALGSKMLTAAKTIDIRRAIEGALDAMKVFGKLGTDGARFGTYDVIKPICRDISRHAGSAFKEAHMLSGNVESVMKNYQGEKGSGTDGSGKMKLERQINEINVEDLDGSKRNYRAGLSHTLNLTVQKEIDRMHSAITSALSSFTGALEPFLKNSTNGVVDKLQELKKKIGIADPKGTESIGGLHKNIEDLKTREFTDESTKSLTEMTSTIQQAIKTVILKVETLQAVPGEVEKKKKDIDKFMAELKHNFQQIKREIDIIHSILTDADNVLERSIQSVSDVVFSAQDMMTRTIDKSKRELIRHVEDAFEEITVQGRLLFSHSRTADLTALKSLVDAQKTAIEGIITKDLANGVKGLLDKIHKTHNILGPIKNEKELKIGTPRFKEFYNGIWTYIIGQIADHPSKEKASKANEALTDLLQKMIKENHFSHEVSDLIKKTAEMAEKFTPANFTSPSSPILQALKDGIGALAKQLGYAYVSTYCCKKFDGALLDPQDPTTSDDKRKLTEYGKQLSKVFMTCLPGWTRYLYDLRVRCHNNPQGPWNSLQINKLGKHKSLGDWFDSRGYRVSKEDNGHDGELKNKIDFTGEQIRILLGHKLNKLDSKLLTHLQSLKLSNGQYTTLPYLLRYVSGTLDDYRSVCHYNIPPKPRAPSNIYLMLQWTAGLKYNHMYGEVKSQLGNVLKGLQNEHKLETEALPVAVQSDMRGLINTPLDSTQLTKALDNVCYYAGETLVAVLGHGHADGVYASDHLTNSSNLLYPGSGGACLDMLADVLFRLYQQLWFLCKQCLGGKSHSGWRDCSYGRYVGGSHWQCNERQCANLECNLRPNQKGNLSANQKADQTVTQKADKRCGQHPDCGMKSPLQSFLEDGLQGFLPHSFSSPGCKLTCTVSNHRGLPCKTPMGFADIGVLASHTKTGAYLEAALYNLCGPYSALSKLCNMLNCVLRRAPQTLDDIFGFFRGYLANWNSLPPVNKEAITHKSVAFKNAIKEAYFGREYLELCPTILFTTRVHQSGNKSNHSKGDLFTISECEGSAVDTCGLYVESLSSSTYSVFSSYHNKQYLSWFLYSAETLYSLLDRLYKQCCNNCTSPGAKCHGTRCAKECQVKQAYEAQTADDAASESKTLDGKNHTENCSSIVRCQNALPTLYMYGFSFGNPLGLCGTGKSTAARRTCKDFCSALKKILEEESALIQLIKQIDEFIWKIRENFTITLLALWSLSLLYLLHIAVVRLDVLRIRSHLRSPSSHRIAAQSLLAVAKPLNYCDHLTNQINNLKNSNIRNENKLSKLQSDLSSHKSEVHSNASKRDGALKDIHSRLLSLAELSGKLGQFIGPEKAVTKAIENAINTIINSNEDFKSLRKSSSSTGQPSAPVSAVSIDTNMLDEKIQHYEKEIELLESNKNSQNPPLSAEESRLLSSYESKLDALQKLKSLNESFKSLSTTQSDNCKNLLNNLCTGLEKFLGYQETSKGYDGTGIVYSDLDRLCDGVMAFLHGVLESVKDDESVKTYDITDGKKIDKVINTLNTNVGKGREAFQAAVSQVSGWLKKHGEQVDKATGEVKNKLGELITKLSSDAGKNNNEYYKEVENQAGQPLADQLAAWKDTLNKISSALRDSVQIEIDKLDSALRGRIEVEMKPVSTAVKMLTDSANDEVFRLQVTGVDQMLVEQRERCEKSIIEECEVLQMWLDDGFGKIWKGITRMNDKRNEQFAHIRNAVNPAKLHINNLLAKFDGTYKYEIGNRLNEIASKLRDVNKDEYAVGAKDGKSRLNQEVNSLTNKVIELERVYHAELKNIKAKVDGLVDLTKTQVNKFTDKIKEDLKKLKTETIKNAISGFTGKLRSDVEIIAKAASTHGALNGELANLKLQALKKLAEAAQKSKLQVQNSDDESFDIDLGQLNECFKTILGKFTYSDSSINGPKTFVDTVTSDINEEVSDALKDIEIEKSSTFATHMKNYVDQKIGNVNNKWSRIKHAFGETLKAFDTGGYQVVTSAINGYAVANKAIMDVIKSALDIITTLEKTPQFAVEKKADIDELMVKLKNDIEGVRDRINYIDQMVKETADALTMVISELVNAYNEARKNARNALSNLQKKLLDEVKKAFEKVTTEIQKLFCKQHEADITALHKLVTEQKSAIGNIMDIDSANGVKGLLARLKINHETLYQIPVQNDTKEAAKYVKHYCDPLMKYIKDQSMTPVPPSGKEENDMSYAVNKIHDHLTTLLTHLTNNDNRKYSFDHDFIKLHDSITNALNHFTPAKLSGIFNAPLIDALRAGLTDFCTQLGHVYVNEYSGLTVDWTKTINNKPELTDDADRCAMLFLTCLSTLFENLSTLINHCGNACTSDQIDSNTKLGKWFHKCGFRVSTGDANRDGELRNNAECKGRHIIPLITDGKVFNKYYAGTLKNIYTYLQTYLRVCHLTIRPKPKSPCNVYEMLCWFTGLTHNAIYQQLSFDAFSDLFDKPENAGDNSHVVDGISFEYQTAKSLQAYPQTITAAKLTDALTEVCHYAEEMLITVLGTGDALTTYAVEFSNNSHNLYYPSRSEECLHMVIYILRKLLQPLRFLKKQCNLETKYYGWLQCSYGSGVQTACWQCGQHSSIYPPSDHACSGTSPLHLYLTDSLRGMLPHQLTSVGCKSSCNTCSKGQPGMPCLTPLGFRGFSGSKRSGKDLCNVLTKFLSNDYVTCLLTVVPKPPSTLPEHFAFACSLVTAINAPSSPKHSNHRIFADAFAKSASEQSIDLYKNPSDLTNALASAYGSSVSDHGAKSHLGVYAEMSALSKTIPCSDQDVHCAPFIECLSAESYKYVAQKHTKLYLSWAIYLPWNLWDYLRSLLDAFQSIDCRSFGCPGCSCKPASHGSKHKCSCRAIVCCRAVLPTFYQYGFTFKDPKTLLDGTNRKICNHFYTQLEMVIKSEYFDKLFKACDNFLKEIRWPFILTLLTLWSLSLLYLLHILVVRLDVLRIRSHLRSPSSHRVAAQSLLAAARVKALANIKYFSP